MIPVLQQRAYILKTIREFFAERNVWEVETPLLSDATVTDPHIGSIAAGKSYLQTSPEYAMKRLLVAGSGSIYQICKAFREDLVGRLHRPEFTMLEWYRIGFDHHALMDEMDELLQKILKTPPAERITYAEIFKKVLNLNPHFANVDELISCAKKINFSGKLNDENAYLDLLFTHCIEPELAKDRPVFLYDFPASQAALSKIRPGNPPVASRFEVYFKGIELANGFHELQDAKEQRARFDNDLAYRKKHQLPLPPIDEKFLAALEHGLPDCAGVALGIDRLVMLALEKEKIEQVVFV